MNENDFESIIEFVNHIKREKQRITFSAALLQYNDNVLPIKSKSYKRNIKAVQKYFQNFLGQDLPLHLITKLIAQKFINSYFERGKEYQGLLCYRILKAIFNLFIEWDLILKNPFCFKPPKPRKNLPSFLTEDKFNLFISFVTNPLLKDFYILLFCSGIRAGEGINLQLSDIDLTNRIIRIRNKENFSTKSRKERIIPLNDIAFNILANRIPKIYKINVNQYIFYRINSDIPLTVDYVSKKFKKYVRLSGLNPQLKLHSLRHSFCTNLVNKNVSLYIVQQLAGHSSINTTQIYSHVINGSLRAAVDLLNNNSSINNKILKG